MRTRDPMGAGISLVEALEDQFPDVLTAWRLQKAERIWIETGQRSRMFVTLRRSPPGQVVASAANGPGHPVDEHLAAGPCETSWTWLSCADVIVRRIEGRVSMPGSLIGPCSRFPGCLVIALNSHEQGFATVATASGWQARLVPVRSEACADEDVASYVSAIHAWITSGRSLATLGTAHLTVFRGYEPVPPGVRHPGEGSPGVRVMMADQRGCQVETWEDRKVAF
jgi:hypothetical protein